MFSRLRQNVRDLHKLTSDVLSLFLSPFSLALRPSVGLVLKGAVDDVRQAARLARYLPINGVEIIGYGSPANPSCEFLRGLPTIKFARIYAYQLMELESIGSLRRLEQLRLQHVGSDKTISVDLGLLPHLTDVHLEWFRGAESIFGAKHLQALGLVYCRLSSSEQFGRLTTLKRLFLSSRGLTEVDAFRRLSSLKWLCLADQRKLSDFSGLTHHPTLVFLWIEACRKLGSLEWLVGMPRLETLRILDCGTINGIEVLQSIPRLKHVHIHGEVKVVASDFTFLRGLPNLESVFIRGMPRAEADYWAKRNARYDLTRQDLAE